MQETLKKLEIYNNHDFKFDPIRHKYMLDNECFISVTQFNSRFHKPFDNNYWSKIKAEEAGISQEEILAKWKKKNDRANFIGTAAHNYFENYYNKIYQELPIDMDILDRINKFNIAYGKWLYKLTPIKFEQRIFSKKWKIAGTIDALFEYNGNVYIADWKTNGKFVYDDHEDGKFEKLLYPFDNYWKNHLNEYSIQVSLYKLILKEVGIDVKACYLLHIGPNEDACMYKSHDFSDILENYLNEENRKCI